MDLSNKSLAMLLLAAIVISLGGTLISLNKIEQFQGVTGPTITGRQTDTGITNLTIEDLAECTVDTNVEFGAGPAGNKDINTDENNTVDGFNNCASATNDDCEGMEINNTGNVDLNVSFNSSKTANAFLGGSADANDFQFQVRNGTFGGVDGGCYNITGLNGWAATYVDVPTTDEIICNNLTSTDGADMVTLEFNVTLLGSTPTGIKTTNIQVECDQI